MTNYTYTPGGKPRRRWPYRLMFFTLFVIGIFSARTLAHWGAATITVVNRITSNVISIVHTDHGPKLVKLVDDPQYAMPDDTPDRLDILILGIRGAGDPSNGGELTDTILLLSLNPKTGVATLTSIPRDLTVRVTDTKTEKINSAYIYNGLAATKKLYSRITGVRIDNIVVFDFDAFKYIVDTIGGITVTLDKPFSEAQQWSGDDGYTFSLPAGENTLDGDKALYYVRSRYSSSDFDRSRRQMQVILAIKAKVSGLNLMSNPIKALELIGGIKRHITTDLNIFDLGTLKDLAAQGDGLARIKRYHLTTENVLYETKVNGTYELLPRDNTLSHIKEFFRTILTDHPVLATPDPTDSSASSPLLTPDGTASSSQ